MNWLIRLLFPGKGRTIRISKDHLPGLKPPKAAPQIPRPPKPEGPKGPDIRETYERFIAEGGLKASKNHKNDRGVGF